MPPKLAFLLGILFVAFVYRVVERRRAANVFPALFLPLLWYILVSSRSTGVWLSVLGVPLPSGGGDTEGSIVDRTVYFVLCLICLCILSRRNIEWGPIFRENRWLIVLYLFMFLSVAWSDYPWVSFKRLVKSFTAVVMRSEEHTSELQSPCNLVCRLLLEKKKQHEDAKSPGTHDSRQLCPFSIDQRT